MITLIRHAKVKMEWKKKYTSKEFDKACELYDHSEIEMPDRLSSYDKSSKVYISKLSRTFDTASGLFGPEDFCVSPLWNEVPLRSFMDTERKLPLGIWNVMGRLQWLWNSKRQPESRKQTIIRANEAINYLEEKMRGQLEEKKESSENITVYVVTHGFYIRTLIKEYEKRGYKIKRENGKVDNLQNIWIERP